ncbi:MAG: hypothetical protein DRN12_00620 [Thermoplasmata archaeon]|nr:MAG: hypothetical protein DRN12_00620 [Thermoplasmata archaeon]
MKKGTTIGFSLFIGGLILLIIYDLYLGFEEIIKSMDLIMGILGGITILGLIILVVSIVIEQQKNKKETLEKIRKEDLEP